MISHNFVELDELFFKMYTVCGFYQKIRLSFFGFCICFFWIFGFGFDFVICFFRVFGFGFGFFFLGLCVLIEIQSQTQNPSFFFGKTSGLDILFHKITEENWKKF